MKKFASFIMAVVLAMILTACSRDMNYIIQHEPNISGKVKEVYDKSVLMTTDDGSEYFVSLNVENSDSTTNLNVGDGITVYYDGLIAEIYPAQINNVYAILLIDPANRENSGLKVN